MRFPSKPKANLDASGKILVMASFFIFLLLQHSLVFLQHDDWGLSVLHYVGSISGFKGQEFSLNDVIKFLTGMYRQWTGRVVSIFILIYAQKIGLQFVQIFQPVIIFTTIALWIKITTYNNNNTEKISVLHIAFAISVFLSIPPTAFIDGLYWWSAASGYIWGMPFFFLAVYQTHREGDLSVQAIIFFSIASLFHEQMAVTVVVFTAFYSLWEFKRIHFSKILVKLTPIVASASFILLAPGNFNRKASNAVFYNQNLNEIISGNIHNLAKVIFWPRLGNVFACLILISSIMFITNIYRNCTPNKKKLVSVLSIIAFVLTSSSYMTKNVVFFATVSLIIFTAALYTVSVLNKQDKLVFTLFVAGLSSLSPLVFAPGVPARSCLPFFIIQSSIILYSFVISCKYLHFSKVALLLFVGTVAITNSTYIYNGYSQNYEINRNNDLRLRMASQKYNLTLGKNIGTIDDSIELKKLRTPRFAVTMPYQRPLIEVWMKKYYKLPEDIKFNWR